MDNRKIGVFDSGLGGLTVVREINHLMPKESVVYFGDTARMPYGSKSKESIVGFSHQIMHFLLEKEVKAVVVACGTASTNALNELKVSYDIPILGVAEPGASAAVKASQSGRIGVIGTAATVRSGAFARLIREKTGKDVLQTACPLFVPLVEEGWIDDPVTKMVIHRYLEPLKGKVDTLVMGCTHYPLLESLIQEEMGPEVTLINASKEAVLELKAFLEKEDMTADGTTVGSEFYTSDNEVTFQNFVKVILTEAHPAVAKIAIDRYPAGREDR